MTADERYAKLTPEHHHFAQVSDPWHVAILCRFDVVQKASDECRLHGGSGQGELHGGPFIVEVWYSVDIHGKLLQEWGFDAPPVLN